MLCEPVSLQVAVVTSGDMVSSRPRQDLIKVLQYQKHYVCNKFMFLDNLAVVLGVLTLQDKHNIIIIIAMSENIKFLYTRREKRQKS